MENTKTSLWEKTKKLIREVVIIVLGVTISIWFTDRYNHSKEQDDVKTFLRDLKEELKLDTTNLKSSKNALIKNYAGNLFLENLTEAVIDSLHKVKGTVNFNSDFTTTKINDGNYEGFKMSGKIGTIENKKLKKLTLQYYQNTVPSLVELEKFSRTQFFDILNFIQNDAEKDLKKTFLNKKFKELLVFYNKTTKSMDGCYDQMLKEAEEIMTEIDKAVGK